MTVHLETMIYTSDELALVRQAKVPRHIAIIPDGNRRWAKVHGEGFRKGHKAGATNLISTVKAAEELGVKAITFYIFSTENWSRSKEEVAALMWLLKEFLRSEAPEMVANGVRLSTIGDLTALSKSVIKTIDETKSLTASCSKIDMILAINYGSRDEVRRAVQRIVEKCESGLLKRDLISEETIAEHLDTSPWGDPDLLIRTSGEMRISNFLLWQLSYSELFVSPLLWPDFTSKHLLDAVIQYQKRERRLGGP